MGPVLILTIYDSGVQRVFLTGYNRGGSKSGGFAAREREPERASWGILGN